MIKDAWLKFGGESRPAYENFNAGYNAGWEHSARIERERAAKLIETLRIIASGESTYPLHPSDSERARNAIAKYEAYRG